MSTEKKQFSDIELVLYISGYNITAYEQFYERYSAKVYSLIKRIIPDSRLAQNILINIFATFLKRIELYDTSKDNVFTWLMLLSRNISLEALKRFKQRTDIKSYDDNYEINFIIPKLSPAINSVDHYGSAEKIDAYKNQLTEIQNLILSVAYFEGLNEEEIAKRLNLSAEKIREKISDTMGSLMNLYCPPDKFSGSQKEMIDLIKLDVLGCISETDKNHLNVLKSKPDFLWKELGDYQNLIALISTVVPIEQPPKELAEKVLHTLDSVLQDKPEDYAINFNIEPPKKTPVENKTPQEISKKPDDGFSIKFKEHEHNPIFGFKKQEHTTNSPEIVSPLLKTEKELTTTELKTELKPANKIIQKSDAALSTTNTDRKQSTGFLQPTSDRLDVNVKKENIPVPNKEVQKNFVNDEKVVQAKTTLPINDRFNTSLRKEQTHPENKNVQPVLNKSDRPLQNPTLQPTSDRLKTEINRKPIPVENKISKPEKPTESKTTPVAPVINKASETILKQKPSSPLQVNETSVPDRKLKEQHPEKQIEKSKAKESTNIEKIISRIEKENDTDTFLKEELFENDEVLKLKRKLKRNYYVSAAVIIVFITAGIYLYSNFNGTQNYLPNNRNNIAKTEVSQAVYPNTTSNTVVPEIMPEEKNEIPVTEQIKPNTDKNDSSVPLVNLAEPEQNNTLENNVNNNSTVEIIEKPIETSKNITPETIKTAPLAEIKKVEKEPEVFVAVEEQPQLIGGLQGIQSKIKYPEIASKLGIEGKVIIQAIVDETGNVISTKTIKGIGGGCDEIALNAVKDSKFIPGKQRGKPVKVQITIPIVFKKG